MGINLSKLGLIDEEEEKLSPMDAALPQWQSMQAGGLGTLGEIAGVDTSGIADYRKQKEAELANLDIEPGRFLQSDNKAKWWTDRVQLNSMNTIAPMMGYTVGTILENVPKTSLPGTAVSLLGSGIKYATYATTYTGALQDTVEEYEKQAGRELTQSEKVKAAGVSGITTYLNMLAPKMLSTSVNKSVLKELKPSDVKGIYKGLKERLNIERKSLARSVASGTGKGFKGFSKLVGTETVSEMAEKGIQIGTAPNGNVTTAESVEDIFEEGLVAIGGASPGGVASGIAEGTADARDFSRARREGKIFNEADKARVRNIAVQTGKEGELGVDIEALQLDIPQTRIGSVADRINTSIKDKLDIDIKQGAKDIASITAFKAPNPIKDMRDRQTSGHLSALADDMLGMFIRPDTFSGELKSRNSFHQERENITGKLLSKLSEALDKQVVHKAMGLGGRELDADRNDYLISHIKGDEKNRKVLAARLMAEKGLTSTDIKQLDNAASLIKEATASIGEQLHAEAGIGFVDNYIYSPVSPESIKNNKEGFIRSLIASSKKAYYKAQEAGKSTDNYIYQEGEVQQTLENARQIADNIIEGRDPDIATASILRKQAEAGTSRKRVEDFEKSRSAEWAELDSEFRETNLGKVIEKYLLRAGTKLASVRTFGKNAKHLKSNLDKLNKAGAITKDEIEHSWDMYDAVHNVYKRDVSKGVDRWRKTSKILTGVGAMTHLGLATISAATELLWVGERSDFSNALKSLPKSWDFFSKGLGRSIDKKSEWSDGAKQLARLGFNINPEINERMDQLFSVDHNKLLNGWFRSPFGAYLTQWTNFNRDLAVNAGILRINEHANKWKTLPKHKKNAFLRELKEQGMVESDFLQIMDAARDTKTGKVNISILDDVFLKKRITKKLKTLHKPSTTVAVEDIVVPWINSIVEDVVIQPNAANKPLWMSNPSFSVISQLKTFPIVFGNTVVKRLLRKLNPRNCNADFGMAISVIGAIAAAYAVAYIGMQLKAGIRGSDPREFGLLEGASTIGLLGPLGLVVGGRDLSSSASGPVLQAIDDVFSGLLGIFTGDSDVGTYGGDLVKMITNGVDSSLGPAGIYFKPTSNLLGEEDE